MLTFDYNSEGIRTKKTIANTATYYYRLMGSSVVEMEVATVNSANTDRYVFIYDADGNPHEIHKYAAGATTPTRYFYVLNLQGDVIQLRDSSNAVVANYTYDAWGRLVSVRNASGATISDASHIANVNPIRYRGYFYDTETKLYYCNSRYYDPQVKRFINADVLLNTGTGFLGYNMFAYCNNNPVMCSDPSGCIVTAWDRAHLDDYEIQLLEDYSRKWNSSWLSAEGKAYQHQLAVEIRSNPKYLKPGYTVSSNGFIMCQNGYVTAYATEIDGKKVVVDYVLKPEVISIDISTQEFADVGAANKVEDLVKHMRNSYLIFYGEDLADRTMIGIRNEIQNHYNLYYLYPGVLNRIKIFGKTPFAFTDNFKVADIESSNYTGDHAYWRYYEPWNWW